MATAAPGSAFTKSSHLDSSICKVSSPINIPFHSKTTNYRPMSVDGLGKPTCSPTKKTTITHSFRSMSSTGLSPSKKAVAMMRRTSPTGNETYLRQDYQRHSDNLLIGLPSSDFRYGNSRFESSLLSNNVKIPAPVSPPVSPPPLLPFSVFPSGIRSSPNFEPQPEHKSPGKNSQKTVTAPRVLQRNTSNDESTKFVSPQKELTPDMKPMTAPTKPPMVSFAEDARAPEPEVPPPSYSQSPARLQSPSVSQTQSPFLVLPAASSDLPKDQEVERRVPDVPKPVVDQTLPTSHSTISPKPFSYTSLPSAPTIEPTSVVERTEEEEAPPLPEQPPPEEEPPREVEEMDDVLKKYMDMVLEQRKNKKEEETTAKRYEDDEIEEQARPFSLTSRPSIVSAMPKDEDPPSNSDDFW